MALKKETFHHLKSFIYLTFGQAFLAALWILLIPGESEHALFLGYSARRLALLLPIILLAVVAGIIQFLLGKKKFKQLFLDERKREWIAREMVVLGGVLAVLMLAFFCFYHYLLDFPDIGAFYRLLPLLLLFFMFGIELMLFVPFYLFKQQAKKHKKESRIWFSPVLWVTFLILAALFAVIEITGMGKSPVRVSIITLGVPLLEGQIWFVAGAIAIYMIAIYAWSSIQGYQRKAPWKYKDVFIFFLIWLIAFLFWMQYPLPEHNYFAPAVRPPTFAKYPFSDAEQYDYNSLYVLFGAVDGFVVSKPLYISFLSILHFIGGFDYGRIVLLQTIVVALLPAVAYLIGKELHSRLAGGGLATFLILREANSILATTMANVSNSKLLMSDLPATLVVAVMVLVIIRWCRSGNKKVSHHVFLLGGLTAVLNLMRIQTLVLIPFFLALVIIRYFRSWKKILLAAGIFLLTVVALLAPIIFRNHEITGVYWLDNPASSSALYSFFLEGSDMEVDVEDARTSEEVIERNFSVIFASFTQNFGQLMGFIFDNFFRNLISTMLILPVRFGNHIPFEDYFRMASPFFAEVYSEPDIVNALVVVLNLFIIALGFSRVYKKHPLAAVMTVLLYLAYNASSSVVRLSGWRFIQPVDWIMLIFFASGIVEWPHALVKRVFNCKITYQEKMDEVVPHAGRKTPVLILSGLAFVIFCAFIPIREGLFPATYPDYDVPLVCTEIKDIVSLEDAGISSDEVYAFCMDKNTKVFKGYGFYPRFFKSGEGYYQRTYDQFFGRQEYARLVYRIVGGRNGKIYIKTERSDIPFKDGDLVYTLLEDRPKAGAKLLIIGEEDPLVIFSDPVIVGTEDFTIQDGNNG